MRNLDLRWRLFIPSSLVVILITALLAVSTSQNVYTQQIEFVQTELISDLRMLDVILDGDWSGIKSLMQNDLTFSFASISVLSPDGRILYQTEPEQELNLSYSELQQALNRGAGFTMRRNNDGELFANAAIPSLQASGSQVLLHFSYSIKEIDAQRAQTVKTIWRAGGAILLLFGGWIFRVTDQLNARLNTLTRKTDQLAVRNYGEQIPIDTRDALSKTEHALNHLNTELEIKFARIEADQTQLNAILEQMTDGVMILTEAGEIALVNPAARQIFDLTQTEIIGQSLPRVLGYHQIVELWQNFSADGEEQAAFLELPDRKKSIQAIITPFEEMLPGHALILFQDLTRLRQLETVRRDFVSNISHELRTPLASLKALAETLQISALDDPESARKFLNRMDTEIDALTQLVSELLELSRIESGQVPLQFSPTNPSNLIGSAYQRLKVQADRAEVDYILDCPQTDATILVDANRIEQTLVNLIHNAIKYTDPGGTVTCTVKIIGDEAVFKIKDTGLGIAAKDLPRIFERFYKVRTNRKTSGTGLGLAIAKHLVELHNGRIWAESQLGVGSTFFIALPISP